MEYGAIDLHKKESQVRIVTEGGEVVDRRIATTRDRFTAVFEGRRPNANSAGSVHGERVGRTAPRDPRPRGDCGRSEHSRPMYSERSRRIKTDRRDVAALADACHRGCYRAAHRRSAAQRTVRAQLNVRRALTDSRTRVIALVRAITRGAGLRIRSGSTESFLVRMAAMGKFRRRSPRRSRRCSA